MSHDESSVTVRLNQQQLELLDRAVQEQQSSGRGELLARALREYHERHSGTESA